MDNCISNTNCLENLDFLDLGTECTPENSENPYNTGKDGVGILRIDPIIGGLKIILTDLREFTFPLIQGNGGVQGIKGDKGDKGDSITILNYNSSQILGFTRVIINFSDLTSVILNIPNGVNGTNGTNGINGLDGRTVYSSIGIPSGFLGVNNDHYINITNGDLYKKLSLTWTIIGNIKGPNGNNGIDGSRIYNGLIPPSISGVNGDYYIDNNLMVLYAYELGGWVNKGSFKGAQGIQGIAGTNGLDYTSNLQKTITHPIDFTGNNYTITNADNNYSILVANGITNVNITIPTGLMPKIQVGFIQTGTGEITFVPSGTTIKTPVGLKIKGINYNAYIEKIGTSTDFHLLGNLKI